MHRFGLKSLKAVVSKSSELSIRSDVSTSYHLPTSSYASSRGISLYNNESNNTSQFLYPTNQILCTRTAFYSQESPKAGFFAKIMDNIQKDFKDNKEMKDNLKKFREDAQKLEESEALKDARKKFESIEGEATKGTNVLKEQLSGIKDKVKESIDEVAKTEALKKAGEFTSKIGEKTENISRVAENIGQSEYVKKATSAASTIKEEVGHRSLTGKVYRPPVELRKRKEVDISKDQKPIEANTDATGVELHADSKMYAAFQAFKETDAYNKFVDARMKYEESENPLIRGARFITDKIQDVMGGLGKPSETSEVLTEIIKMDPNFQLDQFMHDIEKDIIPNILESFIRWDLETLQDWCYEAAYNVLSTPLKQAVQMGYHPDSRVLDIDNLELVMGKMMDQGPVLVISFTAQSILCVRDGKGTVIEGDPDKVVRVTWIWVLCRDQTELDPKAAWRLLEAGMQQDAQFL